MSPTKLNGITVRYKIFSKKANHSQIIIIRAGVLPYSHHGRAKADVDSDGNVKYSDWWGYEPDMLKLLGKRFNFRFFYQLN